MKSYSNPRNVSFGLRAGLFALASSLWACGSGTTQSGTGATTADASAGDSGSDATTQNIAAEAGAEGSTASGPCANPTVKIDFSPMYSAFVPGSTMHTFQVPAVTDDGSQATWSLSDPTQASLVAQTFNGLPGVMITVQGTATGSTGHITVYATESNGQCGSSTLTVTAATEDDWTIGNNRYNDGIALTLAPPPGFDGGIMGVGDGGMGLGEGGGGFRTNDGGSFFERDGGTACTNCHGPTATSSVFRTVAHTPEQTGGFSDDQLIRDHHAGQRPRRRLLRPDGHQRRLRRRRRLLHDPRRLHGVRSAGLWPLAFLPSVERHHVRRVSRDRRLLALADARRTERDAGQLRPRRSSGRCGCRVSETARE